VPAQPGYAPYLMPDAEHHNSTVEISHEGIACTKLICNYIYETYGRFPGSLDAMHLMWFMQAHHLDTDYYDRFFRPGAIWMYSRDPFDDLASLNMQYVRSGPEGDIELSL